MTVSHTLYISSDVIEDTINDNNLQCSVGLGEKDENGDCEGGDFDARATLEDVRHCMRATIAVQHTCTCRGFESHPRQFFHCLGCAVLLCLVCLFDLACFFLSSFSSLI